MRAVVQDRYGPPEVLRVDDLPIPEPRSGQVLVRVHAATVNARDWHEMRGDPYLVRLQAGLRGPRTRVRGTDFAGAVTATGPDVTAFRPGDEVFGEAPGAFAEYVCAPVTAVEHKPAALGFAEAAALPLAANTALVCLREGGLRPGGRVLVNGASGGVGTFAVQIAKAFGGHVTAVCRTRNVDLVRSLGADAVIDYTEDDFTRAGERYDLVLDLVGNHRLGALRRVATPTGKVIVSGGGSSTGGSLVGPMALAVRAMAVARFRPDRVAVPVALPSRADFAELRELVESGRVTPVIDRIYPFDRTADAIRYVEVEHARAKVAITFDPPMPDDGDHRDVRNRKRTDPPTRPTPP